MESKVPTCTKNFKFVLMILVLAGLVATGVTLSNATADKEKLDVGAGVSVKGEIGKSGVEENTTASANVSASSSGSSSSEKSEAESHGNYQSSSELQTQSHENYKMSYEKMNADSKNSFTMETEHHIYKPGDQVSIEGSIWSSLMATVGGISSVSIQVTDNNGNIVYTGKGQVNSDGDYSAQIQLPPDAKNGAYTVDVKGDVSADLLSTLSLKTQTSLESSAKFVVVSPNAFAIKAGGKDFSVQVETNSSDVSDIKFDEQGKKLSFTVQGETGTKGVTEVTIPKSLLSGDLTVMIDGQVMAQSDVVETADTNDEVTLELNYHHSTHQIDIVGTNAAPEFGSLVSAVLVFSIVSIIILSMKTRIFNIKRY